MTIQVVCDCGFRKDVPDQWKGMRVKCKCGRSFVISEEGSIQEPPVAAPPQQVEAPPMDGAASPPEPVATTAATSKERSRDSVAARFRARHNPADSRRRLVLGGGIAIALICLGGLAFVLRDQFLPSDAAEQAKTSVPEKNPSGPADSTGSDARSSATAGPDSSHADNSESSDLAQETEKLELRIAEIELEADDGLLLTGIFGEKHKQLEFTEEQSRKIEVLAKQFTAKAEELVAGEIKLEQWYLDGEKIGGELLDLLTPEQRGKLREMIKRGQIARVRLEEYAARLRPELETPSVAWKIDPDSAPLPDIKECSVAGSIVGTCLLTAWPSGSLALSRSESGDTAYELRDLIKNTIIGSCSVPPPNPDEMTLVAQGGHLIARGGKNGAEGYRVQIWSTGSEAEPKTKDVPRGMSDTSTPYRLVDCVANRVLCVSGSGYWVWNLDSDDTREVNFPDWVPDDLHKCAISPGGRYLAVTHRHSPLVESKQYHFLEIGIYELDTGDLLGNQVVATDYRPLHVGAIAFSYNGRELALLWDVDPPEPKRLLVQMSAISGKVIRIAGDLPTVKQGYARQNNLHQRDLIWLPDNSGWIVNLQSLVDTETDGAINLELPKLEGAETDQPGTRKIVDAIPAGNHRLLLITVEPTVDDPSTQQLQSHFIQLPDLGPFM